MRNEELEADMIMTPEQHAEFLRIQERRLAETKADEAYFNPWRTQHRTLGDGIASAASRLGIATIVIVLILKGIIV